MTEAEKEKVIKFYESLNIKEFEAITKRSMKSSKRILDLTLKLSPLDKHCKEKAKLYSKLIVLFSEDSTLILESEVIKTIADKEML